MFNELGQNIDIYIDGSNNINIENLVREYKPQVADNELN